MKIIIGFVKEQKEELVLFLAYLYFYKYLI